MKLRVGRRARQQIVRIEAWWAEQRPAAPMLFIDELEASFRRICDTTSAGVAWPTKRRPNLRRILMPRSENHLYFERDEREATVYVVAAWGAPRGVAPKL